MKFDGQSLAFETARVAGWRAGLRAYASGIGYDELSPLAARAARRYAQQVTQSEQMTPRQGVHIFCQFVGAFIDAVEEQLKLAERRKR